MKMPFAKTTAALLIALSFTAAGHAQEVTRRLVSAVTFKSTVGANVASDALEQLLAVTV